jgi:hypothetical protein
MVLVVAVIGYVDAGDRVGPVAETSQSDRKNFPIHMALNENKVGSLAVGSR